MNKFTALVSICFMVLVILDFENGHAKSSPLGEHSYAALREQIFSRSKRAAPTCYCPETSQPICASNGVTYRNSCRFQCAKHRVPRLRIVRNGQCGSSDGRQQFWTTSTTTRSPIRWW